MLSMKTILVPMENHDAMQSALETALLLARPFGSYIEGFALRWEINEFGGGDIAGAFRWRHIGKTSRKRRSKHGRFLSPSCRSTMCHARLGRQCRFHSAGWMRCPKVKASLAATAAFST